MKEKIKDLSPSRNNLIEDILAHGCLIMTGTGIVPEHDFSLKSGDKIKISIDGIWKPGE